MIETDTSAPADAEPELHADGNCPGRSEVRHGPAGVRWTASRTARRLRGPRRRWAGSWHRGARPTGWRSAAPILPPTALPSPCPRHRPRGFVRAGAIRVQVHFSHGHGPAPNHTAWTSQPCCYSDMAGTSTPYPRGQSGAISLRHLCCRRHAATSIHLIRNGNLYVFNAHCPDCYAYHSTVRRGPMHGSY